MADLVKGSKHKVSLNATKNSDDEISFMASKKTCEGGRIRRREKEPREHKLRAAKHYNQRTRSVAEERIRLRMGKESESKKTRFKREEDIEVCRNTEDAGYMGTVDGASYPPAGEMDGTIQENARVNTVPGAFHVPGWRPRGNMDEEVISEDSDLDCSQSFETENANALVVAQEINVLNELSELRSRIVSARVVSVEKHPAPPSPTHLFGKKARWLVLVGLILLAVVVVIIVLSVKEKRVDKSYPIISPTERQPTGSNVSLSVKKCFPDRASLLDAVDIYLANNSTDTDVAIKYGWPIGTWCVSSVTQFAQIFSLARNSAAATFNEALNEWDVSNGREFFGMFSQASQFNQDISMWNISSATDLSHMFYRASRFNQSLSKWNVSSVVDMSFMFEQATSFNGNLSSWDVRRVTAMASMFANAASFNSDISGWQVTNVIDMSSMFKMANIFNQNIGRWNVSKLAVASSMYKFASQFNQDISGWSMSKVITTESMFEQATVFNQNISEWDMSAIENPQNMFLGASSFQQDLCAWRTHFIAITKTMTDSMFLETNCTNQTVDLLNEPFHFCESCTMK